MPVYPPSQVSEWTDGLRAEFAQMNWKELKLITGLMCLPAVALPLLIGMRTGNTIAAASAVAGAVSVGFGATQQLTRFRGAPMLLAAFLMAVSAFVGASVARTSIVHTAVVLGIWGYGLGAATAIGQGAWWVCLQATIALVISYAFPASLHDITIRTGLVLLGGLVQAAVVLGVWRILHRPLIDPPSSAPSEDLRTAWKKVVSLRTAAGQHALAVAFVLAVAGVIAEWKHLPNGYWVPMTAAIVIKPGLGATLSRGAARLAGTILGGLLATLLLAELRPSPPLVAAFIVLLIWVCYAVQKMNYVAFATSITVYVVLLLSLVGLPGPAVARHRFLATLAGGCLALLVPLVVRQTRAGLRTPGDPSGPVEKAQASHDGGASGAAATSSQRPAA